MKKGKVKFVDKTRGFGFIIRDDNKKDVYFNIADIEKKEKLDAGDKVTFEVEKTDRGIKATKVAKVK